MEDSHLVLFKWAKIVQKIEPDAGSMPTVLRRVELHEKQVRDAAVKLPFESEPAIFRTTLGFKEEDG